MFNKTLVRFRGGLPTGRTDELSVMRPAENHGFKQLRGAPIHIGIQVNTFENRAYKDGTNLRSGNPEIFACSAPVKPLGFIFRPNRFVVGIEYVIVEGHG